MVDFDADADAQGSPGSGYMPGHCQFGQSLMCYSCFCTYFAGVAQVLATCMSIYSATFKKKLLTKGYSLHVV